MNFRKKTIQDIELAGKRLLIRVDYGVELDEKGEVADDSKLRASLPTITQAIDSGASVVLISHMGRPEGRIKPELSLFPVAKRLKRLLDHDVEFVPECTGERAEKAITNLQPGQVVLLENLRFDPREEQNSEEFARELAKNVDYFVQDGFAVCYRAHTSVDAITKVLPSVAGLLVAKEVEALESVFDPYTKRPLILIVGGKSVSEKANIIERAISRADALVLGGPLSTVFLREMGIKTGKSPVDENEIHLVRSLLDKAKQARIERRFMFYVPQDGVVAKMTDKTARTRLVDWSAHTVAEIDAYPKRPAHEDSQVQTNEMILDIGPFTGAFIAGLTQYAGTVVWSGVLGDVEVPSIRGPVGPFSHGSELVIEALTGQFGHSPIRKLIVGDDTAAFVNQRNMTGVFTLVSTGGGASNEVLSGRSLIGVEALEDR